MDKGFNETDASNIFREKGQQNPLQPNIGLFILRQTIPVIFIKYQKM
jgi:hypothetical protein